MTLFADYARWYDLLYHDKDYAAEARYVAERIERLSPGAKRILELGSGTGRHALLLAEMGYSVLGVERSEEMLASANQRKRDASVDLASRVEFVQGDVRSFRFFL